MNFAVFWWVLVGCAICRDKLALFGWIWILVGHICSKNIILFHILSSGNGNLTFFLILGGLGDFDGF